MFLFSMLKNKLGVPSKDESLSGREKPISTAETHFVNGHALKGPFPDGFETVYLALGCFWGAERIFWALDGVHVTAVGYMAGHTPNPTYKEVCSGETGHTEVVMVVYDPAKLSTDALLKIFWESHDPTQGMRQGNDVGTQYRSGIYTTSDAQQQASNTTKDAYQDALVSAGKPRITTEILEAPEFFYAEEYHQQYLDKNPKGYCGIGGTGVSCPIPSPA